VAIIYAGTQGFLDDLPIETMKAFEDGLYAYLDKDFADLLHDMRAKYELTDAVEAKLKQAITSYKERFVREKGLAGT
jgi:F-type H+-transporting ATPase subunit alpha